MSQRKNITKEVAGQARQCARRALTRGRHTPGVEAKLKSWGSVTGQAELFTRQSLRTDQR